ncbi:hypothetical protein SLEP1_g25097 [Rubroshorea leprosula]|uniref:Uncharacterized protein n=1 Tax=Rubroshorea leprosula TaxID=152421 RepID=A0AAV5JSA0_9ROSI|nr:hypothetical protein SLEP1_g25097 [Rubroshorea leprosula]
MTLIGNCRLETAPADFQLSTTNQTRHCFSGYIEYHRLTDGMSKGKMELFQVLCRWQQLCFPLFCPSWQR